MKNIQQTIILLSSATQTRPYFFFGDTNNKKYKIAISCQYSKSFSFPYVSVCCIIRGKMLHKCTIYTQRKVPISVMVTHTYPFSFLQKTRNLAFEKASNMQILDKSIKKHTYESSYVHHSRKIFYPCLRLSPFDAFFLLFFFFLFLNVWPCKRQMFFLTHFL